MKLTCGICKRTIHLFERCIGTRKNRKIIIGGAPVTKEFAEQIGAAGYAKDASTGVELAKRFLGQS